MTLSAAPKDPLANAKYRRAILVRANGDTNFQHECWIRAKRDFFWYVDSFGWTYSPKDYPDAPNRPFILYPYQEKAAKKILDAIGKYSLFCEKSRDMGVTWLILTALEWRWHFNPRQTFLLGSRTQNYVDKTGDPKSLFWKVDFFIENLPGWLRPNKRRIENHLHNEDADSTIDGESTNDDFARGDRRGAIMLDEFSAVDNGHQILRATRDATKCRFFIGTSQGAAGAHYETLVKMRAHHPERILRFHWTEHPEKSAGLYTSDKVKKGDGEHFILRILDTAYKFLPDYKFVLDGKTRSPWYDAQCEEAASPQEIAQEIDIDYLGSGWQWFDSKTLEGVIAESVRPPLHRGELTFAANGVNPEWVEDEHGRLQLWFHPTPDGKPPISNYVSGNDIAVGNGGEYSSNSVSSILNKTTGEKVAQFHCNYIKPEDFATYVVAICRWFGDAYLIWEVNGPGGQFTKQVKEARYRNVYYRMDEDKFVADRKKTPGWHSKKETKRILLGEYARALTSKRFINRCAEALDEISQYVHEPNGEIAHARAKATIDPTASGENHGDMVIADALANRGAADVPKTDEANENAPPPGSFLARRLAARKQEQKTESW